MGQAVAAVTFRDYQDSVAAGLDAVGAAAVLGRQRRVLIKPNLVTDAPPPVTLPAACAEAVVRYVRACSDAEVLVAEGPGQVGLSGLDALHLHGYGALARRYAVTLVDLDTAELERLENPASSVFPELWLPRVVLESFVVSAAVLKAHSLAGVTLSMKNMMGCAPAAHYRRGGDWNKASFHARMGASVFELNRYRKPDLALVDASVGLAEFHLGGPTCDPPVNRIVTGFDPVAVDAAGATLLGMDWRRVEHIRLADGVLGSAPQGVRAVGG